MTYVSNPFPCFVIKAQHGQGLFPLRCFFTGTDDTIVADDAAHETMSWKHLQQLLSLGTHGTSSHWQIWQDCPSKVGYCWGVPSFSRFSIWASWKNVVWNAATPVPAAIHAQIQSNTL